MESATTVIHRRRRGTPGVLCPSRHAAEGPSGAAIAESGGEAA